MSSSDQAEHSHVHGEAGSDAMLSALLVELREHVPFSVSAVAIGSVVAGTICILGSGFHDSAVAQAASGLAGHAHDHAQRPPFAELFFHLFHPAHMLFSAAATTVMFCRYERKVLKAIVVGLIGAVGICGVSDIVMPHASLILLGAEVQWHICVVEHPALVLPFAGVGVLIGIATAGATRAPASILSHSLHVLASTMASIFYMVGPLGLIAWIDDLGKVFIFVVVAVMVPCCLSDIVFPMLMSKPDRQRLARESHSH